MGSGSVRSTPRVWGPEPHARFGKISRESYQMPELPRGWGARKVCASPIPRLALPNSSSTDSSRGMGGGPWQKRPELPVSGLLCTPSILCGLPLESLPPLRVRAPHHSPSPCLGLAPRLKFKGFKCKYFSHRCQLSPESRFPHCSTLLSN